MSHRYPRYSVWQDTTPALRPLSYRVRRENTPIGMRVGSLKVIGYGGPGPDGARWVVRCACGMYGHLHAKYLRSEAAQSAMCPRCEFEGDVAAGRNPLGYSNPIRLSAAP